MVCTVQSANRIDILTDCEVISAVNKDFDCKRTSIASHYNVIILRMCGMGYNVVFQKI